MTDRSIDSLFNNRIMIRQPVSGYRFSIDPVLLCHFVTPQQGDHILDLGTGCGVIPLILAYRYGSAINSVTGIEIQTDLAHLAMDNIRPYASTIKIHHGDLTELCINELRNSADLVVSNPPYTRAESGRLNPDNGKAIARHELKVTLDSLIRSAAASLKNNGRFAAIYPQERLVDLLTTMRFHKIEPRRLRMVHARHGETALRVLIEGVFHGGPDITIEPPLNIYESSDCYSPEVKKMFQED